MLLVHLTDMHFGCADAEALRATAKYIETRKPDVVVCTGDISRDGRAIELVEACAWLRALPAPVMITPGNHDVPYFNPWGRMFDPWGRFRKASHGLQTGVWSRPGVHIVPINTARGVQPRLNWAQGAISAAQVAQAAAELQRAPPGALRIIATHHPLEWPNDAPIKGQTLRGPKAMHDLIAAGAELFLSGHLHFASARLIGTQALSITSGTLSKRVRHEPCAFTAIEQTESGVLQVEIVQIVRGVATAASKRAFTLRANPQAPAELHPASV